MRVSFSGLFPTRNQGLSSDMSLDISPLSFFFFLNKASRRRWVEFCETNLFDKQIKIVYILWHKERLGWDWPMHFPLMPLPGSTGVWRLWDHLLLLWESMQMPWWVTQEAVAVFTSLRIRVNPTGIRGHRIRRFHQEGEKGNSKDPGWWRHSELAPGDPGALWRGSYTWREES